MNRTRAVPAALTAALAAAALTAPALTAPAYAAVQNGGQDHVYTVRTSGAGQLLGTDRLEAACTFRPGRSTADHTTTRVTGVVTTNGATFTRVRCELYSHGELVGHPVEGEAAAPVGTVDATLAGDVAVRPHVEVCIEAEAQFATTYVTAERRCHRP